MAAAKKYADKTNQEVKYKAMGGNVASYYAKGGKVSGCMSAQNKPSKY